MRIGIDIGGTRAKVAWRVGGQGRIGFGTVDAALLQDPDTWFEQLSAALPRAARVVLDSGRLQGVGLAVPGEVRDPGIVAQSPNLPRWRDVPIGPRLSARLGLPVWVENDANMAAVGVLANPRMAGDDLSNVFVFTLGTGIGGGWLLDGRLYRRPGGAEAEVGHCPVVADGRPCACGNRGCVEAYAGGRAILAAWKRRQGQELDKVSSLADRAAAGNADARQLLAEAGETLGLAAAWVANLLTTRNFVFVGGVANARPWLLPAIRKGFRRHVFRRDKQASFHFPAGRDRVGVLGALHAAETAGAYRNPA